MSLRVSYTYISVSVALWCSIHCHDGTRSSERLQRLQANPELYRKSSHAELGVAKILGSPLNRPQERQTLQEGLGPGSVPHLLGDRIFRESSLPGNAWVCGSGKATAIRSFRHCKPAACSLGLTEANVRLSLICGFPC